jgi:ABC-type transporter MlaC component
MKFMRLMTMLLILILATTPVLASACSVACAMNHSRAAQQAQMAMASMDAGHCEHMQSSQTKHDSSQDEQPTQHNHCSLAGCHFSTAATTVLGNPYFMVNGPDQQPLHFSSFARSAALPPPIKPPA